MADKNESDSTNWQDDPSAEKLIKAVAGDDKTLQELGAKVSHDIMPIMKAILEANEPDIAALNDAIANDPEAKKSYENMMKGKKASMVMNNEIKNLASMVTTMTIDPDYLRESVDNYDFPRERVYYRLLRRAGNATANRLIKTFRFNQLQEFAQVSDGKRPGFQLAFTDTERKATKKEQATISKFEEVFAKEFFFVPNEPQPNFSKFLRFMYQDFYDLDKIAIERVRTTGSTDSKRNFRGSPLGFSLVDSGSIYHVVPKLRESHTGVDAYRWDRDDYQNTLDNAGVEYNYRDEYRYIQVDRHNRRVAAYTEENMILSHAYGSTDMMDQFLGHSIVEQALEVVRYIVDSIIYNYTRRSTGTMPKGMIHVEGATEDSFSRQEMETLRKLIWGIASGRKDKWKYPVFGTPKGTKANFIRFHESSREMEDFLWISTLFSILCSLAGMSPENISLASQKNTLGKQKLFDKKEEEGAETRSNDEGLRFFLSYVAGIFNRSDVVSELTGIEGLEWKFRGLDVTDEGKKLELDKKALETSSSVNDLLIAQDKKAFELMIGDVNLYDLPGIGNPTIMSAITQALQAQGGDENMMDGASEFDEDSPYGSLPGEDEDESPDYLGGEEFNEPEPPGSLAGTPQPEKPEKAEKQPAGKPIKKSSTVEVIVNGG